MSRSVCLLASALFGVVACTANDNVGQLDLSLTGTSASGVTYRLRDADLTITGVGAPIVLHTEDDPTRTLIDQQLDVGSYNLLVADGWRLERVNGNGTSDTVVATLESANPQSFTITSDILTSVVLGFRTQGEIVQMAPGHVGISINVDDTAASCAQIRAFNPAAGNGVYTIDRGAGSLQVFCDMVNGGITYEQLAFGNSKASYSGYSQISISELNDPVTSQAFIALYNLQSSSLINIDSSFTTIDCGIKPAGTGPGSCLFLGGDLVLPAGIDNTTQCLSNYPDMRYRFMLIASIQFPPSPLPADFFVAHPASFQPTCTDSNNPAWFFKRF